MITFSCQSCGKAFAVPESYAGRSARCKGCGAMVTVPAAPAPAAEPLGAAELPLASSPSPAPSPQKIPMRLRRLRADADEMSTAFADPNSLIAVTTTEGNPPELYRLAYTVHSYERGPSGAPTPRDRHEVEIRLTSEYPRQSPHCKMLTPIFHPNIDPGSICVGDHWTAGERLADLAVRIGEMIAYQAYNVKSPLDAEAAMWADLHQAELPTDPRPMRPANMD
jgi:ubiquitin-protein ligase/DNA-directed RNA polymerase subunit RPC12/RpoP